jgi:hypothetical protein
MDFPYQFPGQYDLYQVNGTSHSNTGGFGNYVRPLSNLLICALIYEYMHTYILNHMSI